MSNKLRKPKKEPIIVKPEEVERLVDVEFDEKEKVSILVTKFRFEWGDPIEGDFEHILELEDVVELVNILSKHLEIMRSIREQNMNIPEKTLGLAEEGNPLQRDDNAKE